jgi:hypothetical protein
MKPPFSPISNMNGSMPNQRVLLSVSVFCAVRFKVAMINKTKRKAEFKFDFIILMLFEFILRANSQLTKSKK